MTLVFSYISIKQHTSCNFFSAGVGRTGTLIAIDIALAQASKERQVDIPKIIVDMRKQRMKMVQTVVSYKEFESGPFF